MNIFLGLKLLSAFVAPQAHVPLTHLDNTSTEKTFINDHQTDLRSKVLHKALQVDKELRIREEEGVGDSHVI